VGRGGLGRVLKAFDSRLKRVVAVKEMLDLSGSVTRFVREAIATAGLEHPGIIPVHDAGRWPTGEPFYAMKFVPGRSLAERIAECTTLAERLALLPNVLAVADAMAYAHSERLIHRDLKPANVLVGAFGETVIIDWGIAKKLGDGASAQCAARSAPDGASAQCAARSTPDGASAQCAAPSPSADEASVSSPAAATAGGDATREGTLLGTPAYMAPEQAAGREVDERADVYGLGAILYQVLSGQPPHDTTSADAMVRVLLGRPVPLEDRQEGLPPDLLTIVHKAMAREPEQRYRTALELADDLRRFETGKLVTSHQYSPWALLRRWVARNRLLVALSATLLGALIVTGGLSIQRVVRARIVAEAAQRKSEAAERQAEAASQLAISRTNALLLAQARALLEVDPTAALAVLKTYPSDGSDWEGVGRLASEAWSYGVARDVFRGANDFLNVALSADGAQLVAAGSDRLVHFWDTESGAERHAAGIEGDVALLAVSPDGRLVVGGGPLDKRIWVWDARTGAARTLEGHTDGMRLLAFSPSGTLASTSRDRTLRVWDVATGVGKVLVQCAELRDCGRIAVSPDGTLLAYGGVKRVHLLDVATGREHLLPERETGTGGLTFSRDGRTLVSGGMDGSVRVWNLATGAVRRLRMHKSWVAHVALAPDGNALVTADGEGAVLWDLGAVEGRMLPAAVGEVRVIAFAPDGSRFAIGGDDRVVRVWDMPSLVMRSIHGHAAPISGLAFSSDGQRLASSSLDKTVRLWDLGAGALPPLRMPEGVTKAAAFSAGGDHLGLLRVRDPGAALLLEDVPTGLTRTLGDPEAAHLTPEALAAAPLRAADGLLRRFLADGGYCDAGGRVKDIHACAYARDGALAATAGNDKTVRVWSADTGAVEILGHHDSAVFSVAFSPDSRLVASGGMDRTVRIWDRVTPGERERVLRGHEGAVEAVAFTEDGAKVGSVSQDGTLRIWDLATGEARVYAGEQIAARSVAFVEGDRYALVGERSGSVRMWDLGTGRSRVVRRQGGFVGSLVVSPDGRLVLSSASDGSSALWSLEGLPTFSDDPDSLRRWMSQVTHAEVDSNGTVLSAPSR
jgi:WD40 repeat protein/serine/threonine protein kinase